MNTNVSEITKLYSNEVVLNSGHKNKDRFPWASLGYSAIGHKEWNQKCAV